MDYLLLAYVLYYEGMVPPHTAAGVNLNFWPVGPLLRMGGAFYLRRTFSGNRLYAVVFAEYVQYLVAKGHPIKFYLEGGRSRTGRLLPPKTGLLSMVVQTYLKKPEKPVVFVPIYVGYDKVLEVRTYHSELRGAKKQKESLSQLFKASSELRAKFGKAYIGFGEPIFLKDYLQAQYPNWHEDIGTDEEKPKWLNSLVSSLAESSLKTINRTAVVSPMGVFALVMLSVPAKALPEDDLTEMMERFVRLIRQCAYSPDVTIVEESGVEMLKQVSGVFGVKRFQHPSGDVIYLESPEVIQLTYYRNNIMHLLAIPSLIAAFFNHNTLIKEGVLTRDVATVYPFISKELFLYWDHQEVSSMIKDVLEKMLSERLLIREESDGYVFIRRPDVMAPELSQLRLVAGTLGTLLERYSLCLVVLLAHPKPIVRIEEFEKNCALMARRIAILGGTPETELFEKTTLGQFLAILIASGYLELNHLAKGREEYIALASLSELESCALSLLSEDIRESVLQLATRERQADQYAEQNDRSNLTIN
jgi:glycerol-3-phosphate O-acyltransferase